MNIIEVDIQATAQTRPIPGFGGQYSISDDGNVYSEIRKKVLKPFCLPSGYCQINPGAKYRRYIHALVLEAFVGPRPERAEVNHKNGIKNDNRLENLEWVSPHENMTHAVRVLGRMTPRYHGSAHPRAKLTEGQVPVIKERWASGESCWELGKQFGVDSKTIWCIVHGKTWQ